MHCKNRVEQLLLVSALLLLVLPTGTLVVYHLKTVSNVSAADLLYHDVAGFSVDSVQFETDPNARRLGIARGAGVKWNSIGYPEYEIQVSVLNQGTPILAAISYMRNDPMADVASDRSYVGSALVNDATEESLFGVSFCEQLILDDQPLPDSSPRCESWKSVYVIAQFRIQIAMYAITRDGVPEELFRGVVAHISSTIENRVK